MTDNRVNNGPGPLDDGDRVQMNSGNDTIVVGILQKYVNLAAGWRPRLFVLHQGVLKYYQVYGPLRVDVWQLLERLRLQGDVVKVGVQISVLEEDCKRKSKAPGVEQLNMSFRVSTPRKNGTSPRHGDTHVDQQLLKPKAEIHMQIASVRESKANATKFYVHSGTKTVQLRSESKDDRWVWIEALTDSKMAIEEYSQQNQAMDEHSAPGMEKRFEAKVSLVKAKLDELGASEEMKAYVVGLLGQMHSVYHEFADNEFSKRLALLDIVYRLENEKRQLETNAALEGRAQSSMSNLPLNFVVVPDDDADEVSEEVSVSGRETVDGDHDDANSEQSSEEEFFECETVVKDPYHHVRNGSLGELAAFHLSESFDALQLGGDDISLSRSVRLGELSSKSFKGLAGVKDGQSLPRPSWLDKEEVPSMRRTELPRPAQAEKSISLWSLIKEMVGKDLTRVCLPVYFNEPLSALQKTAEDLEYSDLLDQAYLCPPNSLERLMRVAAFAISPYSSTVGRTTKPFNPLLGETYELVYPERGFRFIAEKVSHHPTIIAAHAQGRGWTYQGDAEVRSKFWGRSIELIPEGVLRLDFDDGDSYSWNKVTTTINNLILGKIYVDHGGIMKIRCHGINMSARIRFKETGMLFDRNPRQVEGIVEQDGIKLDYPRLEGHWDDRVSVVWNGNRVEKLWERAPPPQDPTRYNLTSFAIHLNELTPDLTGKIAPTDCRLRPDQAYTEKGMWEEANAEKQRLEHKQRAARKAAEQGVPLKPRWFTIKYENVNLSRMSSHQKRHISAKEISFEFNEEYWQEREKGEFTGCRDIFGSNIES